MGIVNAFGLYPADNEFSDFRQRDLLVIRTPFALFAGMTQTDGAVVQI